MDLPLLPSRSMIVVVAPSSLDPSQLVRTRSPASNEDEDEPSDCTETDDRADDSRRNRCVEE
jgi:hypothetical protein